MRTCNCGAYVRAVRQLAEHYSKSPDQLSEEELRQYFLYLKNEKQASRNTCTVALCGIKFFYEHTLQRAWPTLSFVRPPRERKLPVVLSREEVCRILGCLRRPHYRVCLSAIYACGLRLQEGVHLQVADIDGARKLLHVRLGKGAKDRYVPLPERMLEMLRAHWISHRHPVWLFPAQKGVTPATGPMCESGVQRAFRAALQESGIQKQAASAVTGEIAHPGEVLCQGVRGSGNQESGNQVRRPDSPTPQPLRRRDRNDYNRRSLEIW